jgi:hypothetical protein
MQFGSAAATRKFEPIENVKFKREKDLISPLQMYSNNQNSFGKMEFDDFATLALERFSVLQLIENIGTRHMKGSNEYIKKIDEELRKNGFLKSLYCSVGFNSINYLLILLI